MILPSGVWVLGPGDSSPEIRKIKGFMRGKFRSYAGSLADTDLYDQALVDAVKEMQRRYNVPATGYIGYSTKVLMGYLIPADTRPVLFTVNGAGVPWWVGPQADTARAVENKYRWQPIGYPGAAFPMGPSIRDGRRELNFQFNRNEPGFELRKQVEQHGAALGIYSEGAVVGSETWEYDIKPANGPLHWAKDHIVKAVAWGNPMREKGKVWPDPGAPPSPLDHKGVTGNLMVDTPDWWRNYAHAKDLYCDVPDDESGEDRTAIWQIVRGTDVFKGPDSLLAQFLEVAQAPLPGAIGAFKAMLDAGMFFVGGLTPHTNYNTGPAIDFLRGP